MLLQILTMTDLTQYVWLIWSLLLLVIWLVLYFSLQTKLSKKKMLLVSVTTSFLGFTEPVFVPEYWTPPSLFDLAVRTGFDIESLIFSFAIGGIVVVLYDWLFRVRMSSMVISEQLHARHRFHYLALISAPLIFIILYGFTNLNPIYSAVISLTLGGLATWYCRPDLKRKMFTSAVIFTALYYLYFISLVSLFPEYVEKVWNLESLTGILITGIPIEELLFAASFGFIWSSLYEHLTWKTLKKI